MSAKVEENLIGAFIFKDHGDGCITAKWLNNKHDEPFTEAAWKKPDKNDTPHNGTYRTTWVEGINKAENSFLEITPLNNSYELRWHHGKTDVFKGIGFLYDGQLVGAYWSV